MTALQQIIEILEDGLARMADVTLTRLLEELYAIEAMPKEKRSAALQATLSAYELKTRGVRH